MKYIIDEIGQITGVWSEFLVGRIEVVNPPDDLISNPLKYEHVGNGIIQEFIEIIE